MSNVPTEPETRRRRGFIWIAYAPTVIALWFAWLERESAKTDASYCTFAVGCPAPDYSSMWMWLAVAVVLGVITTGFMLHRR